MKRVYEISDDEWENESFKLSRVIKPSEIPPPIESFAYGSKIQSSPNHSSDSSVEIVEKLEENLDDDDVDEEREVRPQTGRGRRFVVDEDSDDDDSAEAIESKSEQSELGFDFDDDDDDDEEEVEEGDVVGKALQKCAKISAELRKELYGSAVAACDRYAEVDASSVKIVTQDDICAACGADDLDFQPILKPYQLVGVNFLLLLHRKRIGGGTFSVLVIIYVQPSR
ncbi:hypothetical protein CsSME_00024837 [Camellia sinensis var. sinensis]